MYIYIYIFACNILFCMKFTLSKHRFRCSRPPLRGFLMDGDFYVAASLATTLTKVALRYVAIVQDKKKQNVSCPSPHWKATPSSIIKSTGCSSNLRCLAVPFSPLLQRPCWSWSLCCIWASPLCPRSQLQTMTWTASRCASRFCQSARHLWMTFSIRSAANPCHICWLSDWRRRSCHRR